jgi:nucleoporin NDC1
VEVKPAPEATKEAPQKAGIVKDYFGPVKQKVREYACGIYKKYIPPVAAAHLQSWMSWWNNERTNKIVEKCLPSRELDIIVIEGELMKFQLSEGCSKLQQSSSHLILINK